jgi:hypothetical protein
MKRIALYAILLVVIVGSASAENISQCEWFIGNDPGPGNGNAITVGSPGPQVSLNFTVATGSLAPGIYRVNVRCRTDTTHRWGVPNPALLVIGPGSPAAPLLCTQFEWAVDNSAPTVVDVADGQTITLNQIVATNSIAPGLHRFRVRTSDGSGRTAQYTDNFFYVAPTTPPVVHQVTQLDYWFDSDTATAVSVTPAPSVNFSHIFASANLSIGLHHFYLRAHDETGRIGSPTPSLLIVASPFGSPQTHIITAAEYWVNVDPGPGNGVAIPLPDDGTWDESQENVSTVLTGLPVGLYLVGFRVRDDAGRWSRSTADSLIVGPVLVISSSGSDIVLNWQSGGGASQYKIYRAPSVNGTFALVDSTAAQTYTDAGAANAATRQFYQVTFQTTVLSAFRLPQDSSTPR